LKCTKFEDLEDALLTWTEKMHTTNGIASDDVILEQVQECDNFYAQKLACCSKKIYCNENETITESINFAFSFTLKIISTVFRTPYDALIL
jgi:hypothetical protein